MDKRIIFLIISLLAVSITFATLYFLKKDGTPPTCPPCPPCPPGSLMAIKTCDNNPSFAGKLVRSWKGTDIIPSNGRGWSYFTGPDTTHGRIVYRQGNPDLTDPSGNFYGSTKDQLVIKLSNVPNSSIDAIRIRSAELFNCGLFVIDLEQIPYGRYIWSAFWLNGLIKGGSKDAWAISGEIDIIEGGWQIGGGVDALNTVSLHTVPGYKQTNMTKFNPNGDCGFCGPPGALNCTNDQNHKTCGKNAKEGKGTLCPFIGCGTLWPKAQNGYGEAFKNNGGGIYACNLNCDGTMKFWFIPSDKGDNGNYIKVKKIMSSNASLSTSILDGLGVETLNLNDTNTGKTFDNLQIIINTTVCGDAYSGPPDRDTCNDEVYTFIQNKKYVDNASWKINTINVYQ